MFRAKRIVLRIESAAPWEPNPESATHPMSKRAKALLALTPFGSVGILYLLAFGAAQYGAQCQSMNILSQFFCKTSPLYVLFQLTIGFSAMLLVATVALLMMQLIKESGVELPKIPDYSGPGSGEKAGKALGAAVAAIGVVTIPVATVWVHSDYELRASEHRIIEQYVQVVQARSAESNGAVIFLPPPFVNVAYTPGAVGRGSDWSRDDLSEALAQLGKQGEEISRVSKNVADTLSRSVTQVTNTLAESASVMNSTSKVINDAGESIRVVTNRMEERDKYLSEILNRDVSALARATGVVYDNAVHTGQESQSAGRKP